MHTWYAESLFQVSRFLERGVEKLGRGVAQMRTRADDIIQQVRGEDATSDEDDEEVECKGYRYRPCRSRRGQRDFGDMKVAQELKEHTGAVWCMKFSLCGRFLASGGHDSEVRVWILRRIFHAFDRKRRSYNTDQIGQTSTSHSVLAAAAQDEEMFDCDSLSQVSSISDRTNDDCSSMGMGMGNAGAAYDPDTLTGLPTNTKGPFRSTPFCRYRGHDKPVLDLAWSRNLFLLSSSMDQVRLWHIHRHECLCCFNHPDYVTAIVFHPKDDRYFLSGSMDGRLRLWSIPEKKVAHWTQLPGSRQNCMITCATFCRQSTVVAAGTYDGRCVLYSTTDKLSYLATINVRKQQSRRARCSKITGIEVMPGNSDNILVTSNDSRIRLYDLNDYHVVCKYRGCVNNNSQIKASFSPTSTYIICGSENNCFYIWRTDHGFTRQSRFSNLRSDRNSFWEQIRAHNSVVTAAIFSPNPLWILRKRHKSSELEKPDTDGTNGTDEANGGLGDVTDKSSKVKSASAAASSVAETAAPSGKKPVVRSRTATGSLKRDALGDVIVSADSNGCIRVFKNRRNNTPSAVFVDSG